MAYPSTFLDIQDKVIRRVRLDEADRNRVKDWINQAYSDIVIRSEAYQRRTIMTLTAGTSVYTLPAAVIRIKEAAVKGAGQSEYNEPLIQSTIDDLLNFRRSSGGVSSSQATPTHYALIGIDEFELWPTPSAADTLLIYSVLQPTALTADGDVPILGEPWNSKLLFYGALVEASDDIDVPKADRYISLYDRWSGEWNAHRIRRAGGHTMQLNLIGGPPFRPHDPSTDLGY